MYIFTFCHYLLFCCKTNFLLAENDEKLYTKGSATASNKSSLSESKNVINTKSTSSNKIGLSFKLLEFVLGSEGYRVHFKTKENQLSSRDEY